MQTAIDMIHADILARLAAVRRRQNIVRALHGIVLTGLAWGASLLAALLLEEGLYFGTTIRTVIFWLLCIVFAGLLVRSVGIPLLRLLGVLRDEDDRTTAGKIGNSFPDLGDRLVNILQLADER